MMREVNFTYISIYNDGVVFKCLLQDEKNEIITTNMWVIQVRRTFYESPLTIE